MNQRMPKDETPKLHLGIQRLMEKEARRKSAKKKLSIFLAEVSGRAKMSEEKVFQRLEGHPRCAGEKRCAALLTKPGAVEDPRSSRGEKRGEKMALRQKRGPDNSSGHHLL
jgi:hypothetical protein